RVGVYRAPSASSAQVRRRPHARGGVPSARLLLSLPNRSSPRAWGCTVPAFVDPLDCEVVPTRVGVYRCPFGSGQELVGRPHARGGVPATLRVVLQILRSSPRAWGCTGGASRYRAARRVVPTRVG